MGFKATASDSCVYTRGRQEHFVMITLFVDDILATEQSIEILQSVQDTLKTKFAMSELGPVLLILGMEVIRDSERGFLKLPQLKDVPNCYKRSK
ncbi:unnamed protein product [Sphacelaria rigidula]